MIRFNANLFRLAFCATSNEETRYYLKGVYVEPHAQGGVTLSATDGHRLISIRDESGQADECAIIKLGDALKQCKPKRGFVRVVSIGTGENEATIYEAREPADELDFQRVAIATDVRIDGTFPDYRRVVPQAFTAEGAPGFQGRYIAAFGDLACELAAHIGRSPGKYDGQSGRSDVLRVFCGEGKNPEGSPALILFPATDIAFGILMPCRVANDIAPDAPAWFRYSAAPTLAPADTAEPAKENA